MPDSYTIGFGDLLLGAIYLGVIVTMGYAILCAISQPCRRGWPELFGFSFACGGGIISLILFAISLAGITPDRWTLAIIASEAS